MPKVASFEGIDVDIYVDHDPPHFHAYAAAHEIKIAIASLEILVNYGMPPKKIARLIDWVKRHQIELMAAWAVQAGKKPGKIPFP